MRNGLAGVGRIGALHAATLKGLDSVEQVVVAGVDPARAKRVAKELDRGTAPDVDALFRSGMGAFTDVVASIECLPAIARDL